MNLTSHISLRNITACFKDQVTSPGSFLRNLVVLGSGTLLAQAIPVLVSPILTRIYSPADFAMLAIFMAMVNSFTPVICGKYEVAMVTPKSRIQAEHLLGIAIYCTIGISLFLMIVFTLWGEQALALLKAQQLGNWVFLVPPALLLTGLFTAANYWTNRNKEYGLMSKAKVIRSVLTALTAILAGLLGARFAGLLAGFLIGLGAATIFIVYQNRSVASKRALKWAKAKWTLLSRYRHYPLYNATSGLLDGITLSLPVFFISRYFPEATVGYYALVFRVSTAPIAFISASVSQINLKKVVDMVNDGKSPVNYLLQLAVLLGFVMGVPALTIILWGPQIFSFLFGAQWAESGQYAKILMPAIAIQFVASTLSSTLGATNNNRLGAIWKMLAFASTGAVFIWIAPQGQILHLLYAVTILNSVLYILYFAMILYAAYSPRNFYKCVE